MDSTFRSSSILDREDLWFDDEPAKLSVVVIGDDCWLPSTNSLQFISDDELCISVAEKRVENEDIGPLFPVLNEEYDREVAEMFSRYVIDEELPKREQFSMWTTNDINIQNARKLEALAKDCKGYVCGHCGMQFRSMKDVDEHFKDFNTKNVVSVTEISKFACKKIFIWNNAAMQHSNSKTFMAMLEYKCKQCDRTYSRKHLLARHMSSAHIQKRSLVCDECGAIFSGTGSLKRHRDMVHLNKKLYCPYEVCTHPGFKCSKALKAHIRANHTYERPYSCQYCDRRFVRRNDAKVHEAVHCTMEPCLACGRYFRRMQTLKKHRQKCKASEDEIRTDKIF